jgi:hypothetical protein
MRRIGWLMLATVACSGGKDTAAPVAPTPVAPTPAPTVTMAVSAARVRAKSDSTLLSWTSQNATSCAASGAWTGTQATASTLWIKPTTVGVAMYSLQCTGAGGSASASSSVEAWLPLSVAATSYENWKVVGRGEVSFPAGTGWPVFKATPNAYGFGDYFQTGHRDLVTATLNYGPDKSYAEQMGVPAFMSDLIVWREASDGSWTRLWTGKGCLHPRKILVADFNNDGIPDFFTACTGWDLGITNGALRGETSRLYLSDGRGAFSVREVGTSSSYLHGASAADLDHDGFTDIVVSDVAVCCNATDGYEVFALMNQRDGTFRVDKTRIPPHADGQYIAVELIDVDADGNADLLLGSGWSATSPAQKAPLLLYGDASGRFGLGGRQVTLPEVQNRGVVLDFTFVLNAGNRGLYIGRTGGALTDSYYKTITLQYVDLTTLTSSTALDEGPSWLAWWTPVTRNGRMGVVPYATTKNSGAAVTYFFSP